MKQPEHTIPVESVSWQEVKIHKLNTDGPVEQHPYAHTLLLPDFLAKWDVWDYRERERFDSMIATLREGDVVFDIGTEFGWWSALLAKVTQAQMVLIEPTPEFWPGIKAVWEKNGLQGPRATAWALMGDKLDTAGGADGEVFMTSVPGAWPTAAESGQIIDKIAYRYLHDGEDTKATPMITVDDFVLNTEIVPIALTMDTEGAEILVLRGAERTLRQYHPIVWASIHPDLAIRDGYGDVQNVHDLMASLGYVGHWLATDHEEHWVFSHPEGRKS